ncbi:MAG: type II toxin-antitoxin system MqsR family toxin [Alcanivorax sp.]|nr:type II toxin-antitoxin system MqsR family toxin [Alcanivorax sp.]
MVDPDSGEEQTRDVPAYALERICELACAGKVIYGGRRVELDIHENLQMSQEEVCRCLASLEPSHFRHSKLYPERSKWMDVYCRPWSVDDQIHDLYIKLMLSKNVMTVTLCSFHWQR